VNDNFSDNEEFISIKEFEIQIQFSRFFPFRKRDFYVSDSSDKEMIQEVSDKGIGGDEGANIEEGIEKSIEKRIEERIKEVVEQVIEVVEEVNMEEDIGNPSKL
jgi:hypothetical protein